MSKRSTRRGRQSVPSEQSQAPSKKPRVEDSNSGSGSGSGETSTVVTPIQAPSPAITRDSQHYYEDGSVVLLVGNVLFKVHASLLKARSKVFKDMLTPPPSQDDIKPEGLTDEHPIKITDVTASEFRNLLVIFYALPSDMVSLGIQGATYPVRAWPAFVSLSDVARLTKRFCMTDDEKWAASRLKFLIRSSITNIATGARGNLKDGVLAVFMLALQYAIAIPDISLAYGIRNLIQYSCTQPTNLSAQALVGFHRFLRPRQQDRSLFGFSFIMLLNLGHAVWGQEWFTREERIILFSAQSYLTPLPGLLGEGLTTPVLSKPAYTKAGYLDLFAYANCVENCQRRLSLAWKAAFNQSYYTEVTSSELMKPTGQIGRLPRLRLEFAGTACANSACKIDCGAKALASLDADIDQLFVRLAGYYRGVD